MALKVIMRCAHYMVGPWFKMTGVAVWVRIPTSGPAIIGAMLFEAMSLCTPARLISLRLIIHLTWRAFVIDMVILCFYESWRASASFLIKLYWVIIEEGYWAIVNFSEY